MTPEVKAFVESYKFKPMPDMTIEEFFKLYNHEMWRTCSDCGEHFDLKKQLNHDRCPKCNSKNIK
ncbi:hypothetical protein [Chryseobacterium sp. 2R14A]|uniref:hypothetical protein n=1 Tax=Chryseobacterium sp. 2R14A TaxID=3380353 RepID=UPI003CE67272